MADLLPVYGIGLDLKLLKPAPEGPPVIGIWSLGATKMVPGESRLWAVFGALFVSFRSSPIGLYSKRVYTVRG